MKKLGLSTLQICREGGRLYSPYKTCFTAKRLIFSLISLILIFAVGVTFSVIITHEVHNEPLGALSSSTTYYTDGTNYFTLSSTQQHYHCTNSRHSGSNDYTTNSVSGTCYSTSGYYYDCSRCSGTGSISSTTSCSSCSGSGSKTTSCSSCSGTGKKTTTSSCSSCGGDGISGYKAHTSRVCRYCGYTTTSTCKNQPITCSSCGGSGSKSSTTSCSSCSGSGSKTTSCSSCSGTGKKTTTSSCSSCGGDGERYSSGSSYSHSISTYYMQYTYSNIDTGSTATSQSAYSTATGYTITFNSNGGSGSMSNQYFLHGHSQAINSNAYSRSGFEFLGWSTSNTATSATYSNNQAVTSITTGSSATLYAVWRALNYTVVFDVSGYQNKVGTLAGGFENTGWSLCGAYDTAHVRTGQYSARIDATTSHVEQHAYTSSAIPIDDTTKTHIYYFQYWGYQETAMSNASTQIYWPIEEPSFGSIKLGPAGQWNRYSFYSSRSTNGLAGGKQIRIDFDNRSEAGSFWIDDFIMLDLTETFGAGNEPSKDWCDKNIVMGVYTQTMQYDTATALTKKPTALTAEGFTFKGWSTSPRTTAIQPLKYTDGQSVTNIASAGGSITLYGVWNTNNYLISASVNKENAGSISNGSQSTASGRVLEKIYSSDSVYVLPANTTVPVITVVSGLALEVNQKYLLSLNYVATGSIQFDIDFYPDTLPQILPTATTTEQLLDWEFTPTSTDCTSCMLRLFNDLVQPTTYAVTITNVAIYKITSSTTQFDYIYSYNSNVSLTATPTTEYFLEYWEVDGAISGTSTTLSFNATKNTNIVAHFKLAKTYSYSTKGGEIRLQGNDFQGGTTSTTATYEAVAYSGYYLIGWSVNGEVYKPNGTIYKERTLTLNKADAQGYGICALFSTDANATPTPSYDVKTGTAISAQIGGEARAVGCDLSTLADSDTVTYIAVTDLGYNFDGWYIDGEKVNENLSCRLTKSQVLGKIVEARFSVNNSSINNETNNTDEIL